MFSSDGLNSLAKDIMDKLSRKEQGGKKNQASNGNGGAGINGCALTPSKALVIGGLLGGVLDVDSILVDKDQTVQIVLVGSLKQKSELEKMLDQIGSMPFDEVVKAMMERLS